MRRLPVILLTLPLLLVATFFLWQHRFERDDAAPTIGLADLAEDGEISPGLRWKTDRDGATILELELAPGAPKIARRLPLTTLGPVDFLLAEIQLEASELVPGREIWDDGRLMIEWQSQDGGKPLDPDYLGSARGSGRGQRIAFVCQPGRTPASAALRIENLGQSGVFRVLHCQLSIVRESAWWRYGQWALAAAWLGWAAVLAGWGHSSGPVRPLLAATIWLLMATQSVIPGPWQSIRPLAATFAGITPPPAPRAEQPPAIPEPAASAAPAEAPAAAVQPLGKLPERGNLMLRIKARIQQARPLLHGLLFLVPTLAFALLVGRGRALILAALLALGIESAQALFGYGFDPMDLVDLACDATGIALALALAARLTQWREKRKLRAES